MAASGGAWAPVALRFIRVATKNASKMIRNKLSSGAVRVQPVQLRNASSKGQPIHPAAFLRQKRSGRWYSTQTYQNAQNVVRRWISSGTSGPAAPRFDRTKFPTSNTARQVAQGTGRAPFASTLRPNLTGGAMPRTQGGYSIGGGARYFSHTPAAPAQVMQNVGVAMRAFLLSGKKARFDGLNERGDKRYKAVSALEHEVGCKMARLSRFAPGSYVDFQLSPTITALSPLAAAFPFPSAPAAMDEAAATLNQEGFLDVLSEDFGRALKDLATIFADLRRLAVLGDLPVTLEKSHTVRVRFPGVDAETAERLCEDVGLQRGVICQDADFDASGGVSMALRFPFAPDNEAADKTITSPGGSTRSLSGYEDAFVEGAAFQDEVEDGMFGDGFTEAEVAKNPWLSDPEPEGYESMSPSPTLSSGTHCSQDSDGVEGIYRFLEECNRARNQF
ncbi:hypothetical protein SODALDRAFT_328951 [Sodiomyces alkalinus F11]|uniref:Casein kinase II beta 2 subunit n=1 Tax=Sodiomyces alkalinus (strain CBS 110278 / VKM F-3762 / F11) TaxID=1314773 RepID=A0A3N2PME7_SODAK|nr:hypothetical protein SODALDRAFT_328951 [Sodiomyces alkalinus F11]ROT35584.1 hypothetical protein SODALDRAFT_328951 [Sodiomyces alkalinus F11]